MIALKPAQKREDCRLLVIDKENKKYQDDIFKNILNYLNENDLLVFNNTKVDKARLFAEKKSGGKHEILLIEPLNPEKTLWKTIASKTKKLKPETILFFPHNIHAVVSESKGNGILYLQFNLSMEDDVLEKIGELPLPPYIRNKRNYSLEDEIDYQTVYACVPGSKAAPTAGLHFSDEILKELKKRKIQTADIQLFVSLGTFEPIRTETIHEHVMHEEEFFISKETADLLNAHLSSGKRIIAVGTTVVRTLESAFDGEKILHGKQKTTIFIKPGYQFKTVRGLITNFHTPLSTLLVLVSSFMGKKFTMDVYNHAVEKKYRFFSYGDSMLIL